jgi:hypothetical protein
MAVGWKLLEQSLTNPDTDRLEGIAQVAEDAGVSEDTMYRWIRRPSQKSDPNSTGRKNPIDYFLRLLRAVYAFTPRGARLIVGAVVKEFARLEERHGHPASFSLRQFEEDLKEIDARSQRIRETFGR